MEVPYNKIENLYRRMFQAEEDGDTSMASLIKRQLDDIVSGKEQTREEFIAQFLEDIKNKRVYQDLVLLYEKDINELHLSIEICSLLTHSLVAARDKTLSAYQYLDISGQAEVLTQLIKGEVGIDEIREFYRSILPQPKTLPKEES